MTYTLHALVTCILATTRDKTEFAHTHNSPTAHLSPLLVLLITMSKVCDIDESGDVLVTYTNTDKDGLQSVRSLIQLSPSSESTGSLSIPHYQNDLILT